jgi:fumarate reductase flavoprotein subunit
MPIIRNDSPAFDRSAEVLVVGGGACGMTAALAATDAGANVTVLERDIKPYGATGMSQGYICAAGSRLQKAAGITDNAELFVADILKKTEGLTDPHFARMVADASGPAIDWLVEQHRLPLDVDLAWTGFFGHRTARLHGVPSRTGAELIHLLTSAAEKNGAHIMTGTRVVNIHVDSADTVLGVGYERSDGHTGTIGCEALVLATCGFGANRDMIRRHIPEMAEAPYFGHAGSLGDGILWGQELGAATADMGAFQGYGALSDPYGTIVNYYVVMGGGFFVNKLGRRFSHELENISGQSANVLAQPDNAAWIIYDKRLHDIALARADYVRLTEMGAVLDGATAEALAEKIAVPADALIETLQSVEAMVSGEATDPFGRDFRVHTPLAPPFYGVKVKGALFHTQGGLVVDEHAQVCRADGSKLPNLFAGGGAARSISGPGVRGYLPAVGLTMAITLGRLAGESAADLARSRAAEVPRSRSELANRM